MRGRLIRILPSVITQINKSTALVAFWKVLPKVDSPLFPIAPVLLASGTESAHSNCSALDR
ncbi:hypothetical protein DSQ19_02970 [Candidatus Nitrosotenuis sp. DW1]|nr:hypothetical protein DSQ19_02970 [Candidatus Nitrosotenuis sp. DW1]